MTTELTKAAQQALEACPFCGSTNIKVHSYSDAVIGGEPDAFAQCHDCSVTGPSGTTDAEAAEAWNARAPSTQQIGATAEYWGNLAQQKADVDAKRGVSMPVSYYTSTVVGALLAANPALTATQPAQAAQVPADVQQLVARAKKLAKGNKVDDYRAALADIGRAMLTAAQQGATHD